MIIDLDWLLRLLAATGVGMAIGLNRDLSNKPIGMRTLTLVALGAAIACLATTNFGNLASQPDALSRIMQGVPPAPGLSVLASCFAIGRAIRFTA